MAGQVLSGMANYCNSMETLSLQGDTSYFSNLWLLRPCISFFRATKSIKFTKIKFVSQLSHCLKITQNVAFEFLNFGIFHQFLSY